MPTPTQIERALAGVTDQASFIRELLVDTLGWPIDPAVGQVEDITYGWSTAELRAQHIDPRLLSGAIRQVQPFEGCPWGIFLVEFTRPEPFADDAAGRGMTGTLRSILRGLVPSKRKSSTLDSFDRENVLFICTHDYRSFRIAHFKDPGESFKTAPLVSFGWTPGGAVKTVARYNLPHLEWPPVGTAPADWTAEWTRAFDVERVTKKFFTEFKDQHRVFLDAITGVPDERDRRWYVSALLNRLMFTYFLQRKGFIGGGNTAYLEDKLAACRGGWGEGWPGGRGGPDRFFEDFLKPLFFEGFAKPENQRSEHAAAVLGDVRYLNGGLFLPHPVEQRHPNVSVPDAPFEALLGVFAGYSWNLDDTPGGSDNEINPDVLGYIFEKYINQKEFGAYYTRPEITDYLCEGTIHRLILEAVNTPAGVPTPPGVPARAFATVGQMLAGLDGRLAERLIDERPAHGILTGLSLLDPACGSGAFLIAALKAMIDVYTGVFGWIRMHGPPELKARLKGIEKDHPSLAYFIKKQIITRNIYGVDLMEEATEIARLRLFLALVASADSVDQLEPLPNIDFNILSGNSLIGLLSVKDEDFDARSGQGNIFAGTYRAILEKKNRLTSTYRYTAAYSDRLTGLRDEINRHNNEAVAVLNDLLLKEMQDLGLKYQVIDWDEKKKDAVVKGKRALLPCDVQALRPFHWAYVFDEIMAPPPSGRGGFDAIITNPPWEILEPHAKEFFAEHSDLVSKNAMTLADFNEERSKFLKDVIIRRAWCGYEEYARLQRLIFLKSPDYRRQVPIIKGKRSGKDLNLYKLFLERSIYLLRKGGSCGLVIPSGIYTDLGARDLRGMLLDHTSIRGLFGFENRRTIFEGVDSRFKFVVLTFVNGGSTGKFPVAFMRHDVSELGRFPSRDTIWFSRDFIEATSPDSLAFQEISGQTDVDIIISTAKHPRLGSETWGLRLCREFNKTDDAPLFKPLAGTGRLVLCSGRMLWQFAFPVIAPSAWIPEAEGRRRLLAWRRSRYGAPSDMADDLVLDYERHRIAFRDVASNTNERTMIATVLPPRVMCEHTITMERVFFDIQAEGKWTLNCVQIADTERLYLVAALNSFISDFLLRRQVTNHLSHFLVHNLPMPRIGEKDSRFGMLVNRSARLICTTPDFEDLARSAGLKGHKDGVTDPAGRATLRAEIDGLVAHLYGLTEEEFAHILRAFPLVPSPVKTDALNAYRDVQRGLIT